MSQNLLQQLTDKSEQSQNTLRLLMFTLFLISSIAYNYFHDNNHLEFIYISLLYGLYVSAMFTVISENLIPRKVRIILHSISDSIFLSSIMIFSPILSVYLYPFYLWFITANGARYGKQSMIIALLASVTGFYLVTYLNQDMAILNTFGVSLIVAMVIISSLFYTLISRINEMNDKLAEKVEERTKELHHQFIHDGLTGALNREALSKDLLTSSLSNILLVDIRNFKEYNNLYGNRFGDKILKEFSNSLNKHLKSSKSLSNASEVYRVYGNGFAFMFNLDQKARCDDFVEILHSQISSLTVYEDSQKEIVDIDLTLGVVDKSVDNTDVFEKLNLAVEHAKKKNLKYYKYTSKNTDKKDLANYHYWKNEIKLAIEEDRVVSVFQPIVDNEEGIVKYESLMRLKTTTGELISPYFFLDIAIHSGQYSKLSKIAFDKTINLAKKKSQQFSFNLTYSDIMNKEFVDYMMSVLSKDEALSKRIVFEIVESEDIENYDAVEKFITSFRKLGVKIAIDDFGSGFSNYQNILKIEPDYLKLDGSLIKGICEDEKTYKLVKSIVMFAKSMKMKTIAEFVSNKDIFAVVKELGVDEFQGFYFSEPLEENSLFHSINNSTKVKEEA